MEEMLINERFKSPNKEFEKVFNLFRKKDYFDEKSQVKKKQEEFVRFLKKGDPMATKVFKQNKEDMKSSLSFIEDMVMDYNKKNHFEAFQIFSKAVNNVEMKDSKSAEKSGNFIKSKIHNNSQKYSLGIYSAIRKQKFNNYKDVHKDVDELISKNEGFSSDAQRKAAFANGYEEKGKKKNESVNEAEIKWNAVDNAIVRYIKQNIKVLEKPIKARDEAGTKKMLKGFIDGLVNAQRSLKLESVNEAYVVLHSPKKGVKPVATAAYRDKKDAEKWAKDLGGITMIVKKKMKGVDEASFRPNSGTMSGGTYGLDSRKYELKRDVKGVKIGDYTNITLPKGTIIYNIPGGVFAHHSSLKSYESRQNKYFNKSTFRGISVKREKNTILSIEKNSKILESVNEASIKGRNNKTGEAFGMVIGSDKKNREGEFEVTIRISYSSRISSYTFIFDKSSNLIAIKDYGYSMDGKFPDMKGGGSVKSIRPNTRETITQIAKITSPAFAKKIVQHVKKVNESVNEGKYNYKADALTAYFKGKIDAKELDKIARDDFKSGIATKKELSNFLSNKFTQGVMSDTYGIPAGTLIKRVRGLMKFAEGKDDGVPQGYNPMVEDKKQIKDLVKKVKHEKLFYDVLDTMEKKYGKRQYRIWLEKSLKGFGVNPKHYDYRTNAAAEEKLFQLGK